MRWLITGGCGFIGRNLMLALLKEGGHSIRIVDNLSVGNKEDLSAVCAFQESRSVGEVAPGKVELIVGDILDEQLAIEVIEGVDVVVHLAANTGVAPSVENPRYDCTTNVLGTLNYLEAARLSGGKRFVFASSGAPAGECTPPIHEELPPHPVSPYGASKLAGEGYCSAYFKTFGVETVALRFSNVYGPFSTRKDSVVAKFIKNVLQQKNLEVYGDGAQTRDFLYIDDLVSAIRQASSISGIGGETFQIATARETSVGEMADVLLEVFAQKRYSLEVAVTYTEPRLGDVKRNYSDTTKAKQILKWSAGVSLEEGLSRTVDWFLCNS